MKIKKNLNNVLFFDILITAVAIFLVLFCFVLGMREKYIFCISVIAGIIGVGLIVFASYYFLCRSYYEFRDDGVYFVRKGQSQLIILYNDIDSAIYYGMSELFPFPLSCLGMEMEVGSINIIRKGDGKKFHIAMSRRSAKKIKNFEVYIKKYSLFH